jgi:peptide-methionine (S)-S-oxide reductase
MEREPTEGATKLATFGAGCFWCVEAVFERIEGVEKVVSGYSGGATEDPTYEEVCSGRSGHAEVCQISYDPERVGYEALLEVFFKTHDPTTLNRQGGDVGSQYRSAIFFHDEEQRKLAEAVSRELDGSGAFKSPIVTEIAPFKAFYPAEAHHQDYYDRNRSRNPYCQAVIVPKLEKLEKVFADRLKKQSAGK